MATEIGCKPPWDTWSPSSIPVCDSLKDNSKHEERDWKYFGSEKKLIMNSTRCLKPCQYREHKIEQNFEGSTSILEDRGDKG